MCFCSFYKFIMTVHSHLVSDWNIDECNVFSFLFIKNPSRWNIGQLSDKWTENRNKNYFITNTESTAYSKLCTIIMESSALVQNRHNHTFNVENSTSFILGCLHGSLNASSLLETSNFSKKCFNQNEFNWFQLQNLTKRIWNWYVFNYFGI